MSSQFYLSYNPNIVNGSNITGFYTSIAKIRGEHYIPVTQVELNNYKTNANSYRVDAGKLTKIVAAPADKIAAIAVTGRSATKNEIISPIEIEGKSYIPDMQFQLNLALGLHNTFANPESVCRLWCLKNDAWEFLEHTRDEMLKISMAINARREELSASLYSYQTE